MARHMMMRSLLVLGAGLVLNGFATLATSGVAKDGCPFGAPDGQTCGGESLGLLQRRALQAHPLTSGGQGGKKAVAYEGDGFYAMAIGAATTSAMLHALAVEDEKESMNKLFKSFDMITSNSGGSWYASSVLYSPSYVDMLRDMGREPKRAEKIYSEMWVEKLLEGAQVQDHHVAPPCAVVWTALVSGAVELYDDFGQIVYNLCRKLGGSYAKCQVARVSAEAAKSMITIGDLEQLMADTGIPWKQNAMQAAYVYNYTGDVSWTSIISAMLEKTAGIGRDVLMGSEPNKWAVGKEWHPVASLTAPSVDNYLTVWYFVADHGTTTASSQSSETGFVPYVPVHFSVQLGNGTHSQSPYPFCANRDCFDWKCEVTGSTSAGDIKSNQQQTDQQRSSVGGLMRGAGALSVANVTSSSSAAMGGEAISKTASALFQSCSTMATWVSGNRSDAYSAADEVLEEVRQAVTQNSINKLANNQVQSLIDGAFTDNTGIAWAVSSGATEVVAVVNKLNFLFMLFNGGQQLYGFDASVFSTSVSDVQAACASFPKLTLPAAPSYLQEITYGTIQTTTKANKWFGVKAGRRVTLRVLNVEAKDISMMLFSDYYDYATLVGEISTTFADRANAHATREILNTFYLGRSGR